MWTGWMMMELLLVFLIGYLHFGDVLLLHWGHDEAGVADGVVLWVMVQGAEVSWGSRDLLF